MLSIKPRWTCAKCGMYLSRKYSVRRHIENLHYGIGNVVSFIGAMEGWGTDEESIYSALDGLTLEDITAIEEAYLELTGRELIADLRDDLSGDELERALGLMHISPNIYEKNTELGGLFAGNFDFHFNDCTVLIWVWIKFQFSNDITIVEQKAFKKNSSTRFIKNGLIVIIH